MTAQLPWSTETVEFPYTRSTGPVVGAFLTGLRSGRLLGARIGQPTPKVYCPPVEFDPDTYATPPIDLVEVGPDGTILAATWISEPTTKHPFAEPFAFALILLDGADTPLVHAVQTSDPTEVTAGSRVRAHFKEDPTGAITDVWFMPDTKAPDAGGERAETSPVLVSTHLISLTVTEPIYPHRARFAHGLLEGRIIGQRSPASGLVSVPGRGFDSVTRTVLTEADDVDVADIGTVTAFTEIAPVSYYGQTERRPWVRADILFDGADQPTPVDMKNLDVRDVRVGMRVRAAWRPPHARSVAGFDNRWTSIPESVVAAWEPTDEPDVGGPE